MRTGAAWLRTTWLLMMLRVKEQKPAACRRAEVHEPPAVYDGCWMFEDDDEGSCSTIGHHAGAGSHRRAGHVARKLYGAFVLNRLRGPPTPSARRLLDDRCLSRRAAPTAVLGSLISTRRLPRRSHHLVKIFEVRKTRRPRQACNGASTARMVNGRQRRDLSHVFYLFLLLPLKSC